MIHFNKPLSDPTVVDDILKSLEDEYNDAELFVRNHKTNRLFIICPSDGIETYIRKHFMGNNYILPILGLSLNLEDQFFREQLQSMIAIYDIAEINLIQRVDNRIISDILRKKKTPATKAEIQLEELLISCCSELKKKRLMGNKIAQLCQLQICKQTKQLDRFIALELNLQIPVRGFIFEIRKHQFVELSLNQQGINPAEELS